MSFAEQLNKLQQALTYQQWQTQIQGLVRDRCAQEQFGNTFIREQQDCTQKTKCFLRGAAIQMDMAHKIKIAVKTSKQISEGKFIICARTDAKGVLGLQQTIKRSKLYVDSGADMIFPEGLHTKQQFEIVSKELKGYGKKGGPFLLANMTQFGKTPYIKQQEFEKMGYHLIIYPVSTLRVASKAIQVFLKQLKAKGGQQQLIQKQNTITRMQTREQLYKSLNYKPGKQWQFPSPSSKL